ncbi:MAG TPA: hypothetical protein GXX49_01905 [Clostridiaceae bacterium]|nr:hypothetical protein [Clostridiaceae bacterium]
MSVSLPRVRKISKIIQLDNFRGFERLNHPIDVDGDIVFITGKNGVGKSSILYALDCFLNGFDGASILCKEDIGEMVRSGSDKADCLIEYYDLESNESDKPKSYHFKIYEDRVEPNTGDNEKKKFRLQQRASVVYQDMISDPRIDELIKNIFPSEDDLQIEKNLSIVASSIEQELRNKYLRYEGFNAQEKRRPLISEFASIISRIKSYESKVPKSIHKLNISNLFDWTETYIVLKDFVKNIEYELDINDTENLDITPQDIIIRIRKAFSIMEDMEKKHKHGSNEINKEQHFTNFLRTRTNDRRILKVFRNISTLKDIPLNTVILACTDSELNSIERLNSENSCRIENINEKLKIYKRWSDIILSVERESNSFDLIMKSIRTYNKLCEQMKNEGYPLPETISQWLKSQEEISIKMELEFLNWKDEIEKKQRELEEDLLYCEQLKRNLEESIYISKELRAQGNDIKLDEFNFDNKDFWDYRLFAQELLNKISQKTDQLSNSFNLLGEYNVILNVLDKWIDVEKEILYKENEIMKSKSDVSTEKAKSVLNVISKMSRPRYKLDLPKHLEDFKKDELERFNRRMNIMLKQFHFPLEFLPVNIEREKNGRRNSAKYSFFTGGRENPKVDFSSLSTGQKVQLYFCWTIAFNYSLQDRTHNIMLFDDITTSLDMSQLLPAATFLRQMAYCDDQNKRQVFISCHHEDFSNKLLDYLMPPPGYTLKVIRFIDLVDGIPVMEHYNVKVDGSLKDKKVNFLQLMSARIDKEK